MRPVLYVPAPKVCSEIFAEMTAKKIQIAIVLDEYGGTAGVISPNDVLEIIFGPEVFAHPQDEPAIVRKGEDVWEIDARASLDEINRALDIELEAEDADRLSGWIQFHAERIPHVGQQIVADGCRATVLKRRHRRVVSVCAD